MKEIKSRDTTFLDDKFPSKTFAAKGRFILTCKFMKWINLQVMIYLAHMLRRIGDALFLLDLNERASSMEVEQMQQVIQEY